MGDSVLTHEGRFKTVTHTLSEYDERYDGDIYTVAYRGQYGKLKKLRVTPEHKFLTQEGWKRADELSNEDSLRMLTLPCEDCGEYFDVINDRLTCKTCTHKRARKKITEDPAKLKKLKETTARTSKKYWEELKEDLNRVMSNHNGNYKFRGYPIEHINCEAVTNNKLHDITVADDHSFIVEGIVSHNCNCPMEAVPDGFVFDQNGDLVPE